MATVLSPFCEGQNPSKAVEIRHEIGQKIEPATVSIKAIIVQPERANALTVGDLTCCLMERIIFRYLSPKEITNIVVGQKIEQARINSRPRILLPIRADTLVAFTLKCFSAKRRILASKFENIMSVTNVKSTKNA